jgi:hypothetical protein
MPTELADGFSPNFETHYSATLRYNRCIPVK